MKRKARVLHIITRLISGGADENTIYSAEGLDRDRYEVDLAAGEPSEADVIARLRRTRFLRIPHLQRELRPVKDALAFRETVELLRAGRYDLVHTHEAKAGIIGRLASWHCGVPKVVHTLHGITFHRHLSPIHRYLYLALERLAAKATDVFISVGEDLRRTYLAHGVGEPFQHVVIRSGFDLEPFFRAAEEKPAHRRKLRERLGLSPQTPVIGTAARLEPRKGVQYFLEAAVELSRRHRHLHFAVAGRGPFEAELRRQAAKASLEDRVHFLGHVREIESFLAGLDVFVLSSLWEGLPRAIVQARATRTPVVGFEVEGIREVVRPGRNGFIVPSKDVASLVERIDEILSDAALAERLANHDDRAYLMQWDRRRMVREIQALYDSLLGLG